MKPIVMAAVAAILAVSTAGAQIVSDSDSPLVRTRLPSTLKYLNERIDQVSFEQAPLDQVIDWIAGLTPMNVVVRWQTLEEAGVERDKPITMQVRNLRLSQVLWMIMQEAGGPDLKLAYRASGELLIVSTAEDLGKEMVTRVYDVSDLLVRAEYFQGAPHMDMQNTQGMGQGGGGGQSIFGGGAGSGRDEDRGREREGNGDIVVLMQLIVNTVEPDSWAVNGGGQGTIQPFRNLLVVRNNILVHQALGGYVEEVD